MTTKVPSGEAGERWRRVPQVLWRNAGGDLMLLCPGLDAPMQISGPGLAMWHLLAKGRELDDVLDVLADVFAADRSVVASDITPLLRHLVDVGAVERSP